MVNGFISLHRKIREHWIWDNSDYLKWWLDLLMMANHEPKKILINGKLEIIDIGETHTSESKLSKRWFSSRTTIDKFLKILENDGMIEVKKSRQNGTTIKVRNYQAYQDKNAEEKTTDCATDCASKVHRKCINNNENNENNIYIAENSPEFSGERENFSEKSEKESQKTNVIELDGDETFEKSYKFYPRKDGKADGKKNYINFLTNGRKIKGQPNLRYNHIQIGIAIKQFAEDMSDRDMEFIKEFSTFMSKCVIDYVDKTVKIYETAMFSQYGENWRKIKFKYKFKGG